MNILSCYVAKCIYFNWVRLWWPYRVMYLAGWLAALELPNHIGRHSRIATMAAATTTGTTMTK